MTWSLIFQAVLNLLNPVEILRTSAAWLWYLLVTLTLKTPILLCREVRAASLLNEHHYYPDSLVSILSCYLPLIFKVSFPVSLIASFTKSKNFQSTLEVFSILAIMLSAPFAITGELLFRGRNGPDFRSVSQSGRKVVAWSEEIDLGLLRKIGTMSGASDAVILLAAAVDSLKEYFRLEKNTSGGGTRYRAT